MKAIFLIMIMIVIGSCSSLSSPCKKPCKTDASPKPKDPCLYGYYKGDCMCCYICAKGPGEKCGDKDGQCAYGLTCKPKSKQKSDNKVSLQGTCTSKC